MSKFTTPANLEMLGSNKWKVLTSFDYYVSKYPSDECISVPEGFITDLASIPRILWPIFPPHGEYAKAAIIHDYMYEMAIRDKNYADKIFLEAMGVLGVPNWKKKLIYLAVKYFGKGNYK